MSKVGGTPLSVEAVDEVRVESSNERSGFKILQRLLRQSSSLLMHGLAVVSGPVVRCLRASDFYELHVDNGAFKRLHSSASACSHLAFKGSQVGVSSGGLTPPGLMPALTFALVLGTATACLFYQEGDSRLS